MGAGIGSGFCVSPALMVRIVALGSLAVNRVPNRSCGRIWAFGCGTWLADFDAGQTGLPARMANCFCPPLMGRSYQREGSDDNKKPRHLAGLKKR